MTNYVLNINKPEGYTSHDVVARLRGILKTRKIGHCGTLDPLATGVLPICVGKATKASEFIMGFDKEYVAGVKLGLISDTQDITGNVSKTQKPIPKRREVHAAAETFVGDISQIPPMYSAIKIGGKKLYEIARTGGEVERPPRRVNIRYIEILDCDETAGEYTLKIGCSKGTYVRTLCHDIGAYLGCGAVMTSLVRTKTGAFEIDDAVTLEDIEAGRYARGVYTLASIFKDYETLVTNEEQSRLIKNGVRLSCGQLGAEDGHTYAVYEKENESLLMLAGAEDGVLKMIRGFW